MKSIVRMGDVGKRSRPGLLGAEAELNALDSRVELIQALIPLGLEAVQELLQQEVAALAGLRIKPVDVGPLRLGIDTSPTVPRGAVRPRR